MKFDARYKITFAPNEKFDVNYILDFCRKHPNENLLIQVENTKGISSYDIRKLPDTCAIRIAGAYDSLRVDRMKNVKFKSGETGEYYTTAVTYSKNETVKILEQLEKIEKGFQKDWSEIQKLVYVYDILKTGIMYDPKFETKFSNEIRSLRGLVTKQTVCAGYSVILKEIMDRQGIECEYVEGNTDAKGYGAHAWNIVCINGKKYPVDLTWDNTTFRSGKFSSFDWLCQDVKKFASHHYPSKGEKTQDYEHTLSQIDPYVIKSIASSMTKEREYQSTSYVTTRSDGSKFSIAQIGDAEINGKKYFRYYYRDINKDGSLGTPIILFSGSNLQHFIDCKRFGRSIPDGYGDTLKNILFSKENIERTLKSGSLFLGNVSKGVKDNKPDLVKSVSDIPIDKNVADLFKYPTKTLKRRDGSEIIIQQMFDKPHDALGIPVMRYDLFELVNENGKSVLHRNKIYTEQNLFLDTRQEFVDDFLSRERLDRKVREAGGYIGYYDKNGIRRYDPKLVEFFKTDKTVQIEDLMKQKQSLEAKKKQMQQAQDKQLTIPSFEELKELASKYEIFIDSKDPLDPDPSKIKIRDIETHQVVTDKNLVSQSMLANIWLTAAGVKYYGDEKRNGERYAFNEQAKVFYDRLVREISNNLKNGKGIDTVDLFKQVNEHQTYKYDTDILIGLFRTPYQAKLISDIFKTANGVPITPDQIEPEALYNLSYAGGLAYSSQRKGI